MAVCAQQSPCCFYFKWPRRLWMPPMPLPRLRKQHSRISTFMPCVECNPCSKFVDRPHTDPAYIAIDSVMHPPWVGPEKMKHQTRYCNNNWRVGPFSHRARRHRTARLTPLKLNSATAHHESPESTLKSFALPHPRSGTTKCLAGSYDIPRALLGAAVPHKPLPI